MNGREKMPEGITTVDDDMVSISLLGLPKSWNSYQDSVNGREKLPDWERLWSKILCRRRSEGAHETVLYPRMMMKKIWP